MIKKEEYLDRLVDKAIKEYPLDPVPADLFEKIMVRVENQMVRPVLKFSWVDFSLSALLAGFIGIFLELIQILTRSPYWSAWARVEMQLILRDARIFFLQNQSIILVSAISLGTFISLLFVLKGIYRRQILFDERLLI